jgi:acyl-CoA synthetase (AMP-forming)/AMP-acid ligase II/thioesterase domain-containing protein
MYSNRLPTQVAARLEFWTRADPAAPAIGAVDGPMMSRAELTALMAGGSVLRRAGLRPGDRVALLLPGGFDAAVTTLQVAAACSIAPLRPSLGAVGWKPVLRALAPGALVVSDHWPEAAEDARELGIPVFGPDELRTHHQPGRAATVSSGGAEILLATSGSTGPPKWVRIPQSRMLAGSLAMTRCMGLTIDDRSLLALPLDHAHGLASGLLLPLMSGGSVVVAERFDAALFLKAVTDYGVTWFTVPPVMHRALLDQHAITPLGREQRLRLVRSGTVTLSASAIEALSTAFGVPVIEAYGMTECPHITCNPVDAPRLGSVGQPIVEELAVVDDAGRPTAAGEWGQVVLRGAPALTGYLDSGADTAAFRDGWLLTGDEGRLDADGYLFLRGRISERINRGGAMVAPSDIDAALLAHPAVREAVSFPVAHPSLGEDLAAAVVVAAGHTADEAGLRRYLVDRLEPRQVPSRIIVVDAIPLGAAGKVSRGGMADALAGVLHAEYEPGRNPVEEIVIECFKSVLGSRLPPAYQVGRLTNFFLAGGDSLAAMQCMLRLACAGWGECPPTLLVENPTPADVATARGSVARDGSHLVTLQPKGGRDPLIVVHGSGGQLFHYLDLATALAPGRPVLGLQTTGMVASGGGGSSLSVSELAVSYAEDILEKHGHGPVHLVGYSVGGWYAWAVAAALLERGATIGLCAILDSHALRPSRIFSDLPAVMRGRLLVDVVAEKLRRETGRQRVAYLTSFARKKMRKRQAADPRQGSGNPDFLETMRGYSPPQLPITVDLFGPGRSMKRLRRAWRHYATAGVRCHPLFEHHTDLVRPDLMSRLAAELEDVVAEFESARL